MLDRVFNLIALEIAIARVISPIWVVIFGAVKLFGDPGYSWFFVFAPVLLLTAFGGLFLVAILAMMLYYRIFK